MPSKKPQRGETRRGQLGAIVSLGIDTTDNPPVPSSFQENSTRMTWEARFRKKRPQPRGEPGQDRSVATCAGAA